MGDRPICTEFLFFNTKRIQWEFWANQILDYISLCDDKALNRFFEIFVTTAAIPFLGPARKYFWKQLVAQKNRSRSLPFKYKVFIRRGFRVQVNLVVS